MECSTCPDGDKPKPEFSVAESPGCLRFSLRTLLIGTMAICMLLAILVPSIRHVRRSEMQRECMANLKLLGLALHDYHDVHRKFPSATTYAADGRPMHSWRVLITPWLDDFPFFSGYDRNEPWDGPNNRRLGDDMPDSWRRSTPPNESPGKPFQYVLYPSWYRCPSAPVSQDPMCTNYVMLIDDRPGKPNGPPHLPGSVPPSLNPGSAVWVIEIADSDIHWMEPRDVLLSELSMKINDRSKRSLASYHGGACVLHADGSVEILDEATTEERVRELLAQ